MDELTSAQLSEWEAYDVLDPVGKWRDDYHAAFIVSEITNIVSDLHGEKGTKRTTPLDYMPKWNEEDVKKKGKEKQEVKKQSVGEMREFMLAMAEAHNKKIRQKRTTPPRRMNITSSKEVD